jgi:hypothetical protein
VTQAQCHFEPQAKNLLFVVSQEKSRCFAFAQHDNSEIPVIAAQSRSVAFRTDHTSPFRWSRKLTGFHQVFSPSDSAITLAAL